MITMTVKELKGKIKDLPDDAEVLIEYADYDIFHNWENKTYDVEDTEFFDWSGFSINDEFVLRTFKLDEEEA